LSCVAGAAAAPQTRAAAALQPFFDVAVADRQQGSAGVDWLADGFRVRSHLTVRADGGRTYVAPQVLSSFAIAPKVSVETRLDLAEWNTHSALLDSAVEVKFRVRSDFPLLDAIEGRVWRAPDGLRRNTLRLALAEELVPGDIAQRPLTLNASLTLERAGPEGAPTSSSRGLQATLAGFGRAAAENRVAISYQEESGRATRRASSISFGRSWPINAFTHMMLTCELIDADFARSHKIAVSWRGEF
jgi:hypothetical protein